MNLPFLVEGSGDQICECGGFDVTALLQRVQIHLELHPGVAASTISRLVFHSMEVACCIEGL